MKAGTDTSSDRAADGGSYDIVCLSHLRWGFVFQRPQHLLTRCAADRRVFFVEEPIEGAGEPAMQMHKEGNVTILVPSLPADLSAESRDAVLARLLDDMIEEHGLSRYVLWYYTPMATAFTRHLRPLATVYDCMDELSAFSGAPKELRDREGELFDSADVVFTGGRSLYESKRTRHARVHLFPSSVDADHFRRAREPQEDPADQRAIPHPRLGYYGVIDERMDLDLLDRVAAARPDWSLVLVGPVVKIDESTLPHAANIHYLGAKSYDELPLYAAAWDVAMMPFAMNDSTRFISPTKTPEYLAAGLPVVTTPVEDVVAQYGGDSGLVHVASNAAQFIVAAERAMAEDRTSRIARVDEMLRNESWDATWRCMNDLIDAAVRAGEHKMSAAPLASPAGRANGSNGAANGNGAVPPLRLASERVVRIGDEGPPPSGFDYLIVGAGFAGTVLAERLANEEGKKVLVVDKRNHIAGNAFDHYNDEGLLVHRYGPHIFHTNSADVFAYLSQFTKWRPYQHRVIASVHGQLVPIPINLDTINQLYGLSLTANQVEDFFASVAEPVEQCRTSEDVVVRRVGRELYELFFRNYTRKQWGLDPSELDASVTARVPVRTNRDARYFTDKYQAMPEHGYTRMFEKMLAHPNIKVMLNTSYREVASLVPYREIIFTGPIDEFFGYRFGRLPYRSLEFEFETHDVEWFQPAPVVNYPNDYDFTRVTEFKYLTGQTHSKTSLVYEFPKATGDPYYPVPRPENAALYRQYKELAEATPGVHFVGRLGTYKYYNMDQVVAQALAVYRRIAGKTPNDVVNKDELDGAISPAGRVVGRHRMHAQPRR
ncbi:MAG TPA: UDP-galactopyranose mutase [Actinomycetota bacterium]|nr:UDP-galactopyranose mutase [Actinomycetota bacterium]